MKKKEEKSVVVENAKNYYSAGASEKSSKSDGGGSHNNKIEDHFTVACVNAFLVNASRNLNDIHAKSRKEVQKIEEKMRKMERSLVFLEKKLEGFDDDGVALEEEEEKAFSSIAHSSSNAEAPPPPSPPPPPRNDDDKEEEDNRIEKKEASSVVANPMHEKYHKMIRIGVPEQAVRNKMKLDGVDDGGVVF